MRASAGSGRGSETGSGRDEARRGAASTVGEAAIGSEGGRGETLRRRWVKAAAGSRGGPGETGSGRDEARRGLRARPSDACFSCP